MSEHVVIRRCRIIGGSEDLHDVSVRAGRIEQIAPTGPGSADDETIDAGGLCLVPGFVDVHVQGAGGADVLDGSIDSLATISRTVGRFGTVGWLATTLYYPDGENDHLRVAGQAVGEDFGGAKLLGVHLEGPFISVNKQGGIPTNALCQVDRGHLDRIFELCGQGLKMMTIAPELAGAPDVIKLLVDHGVIAAFAHSDADYDQTRAGISAGIRHVTHMFNTMRSIHHRNPGPIPAILEDDSVTAQIICDGAHVAEPVVRMAGRTLGPNRVCAITDGSAAMGTDVEEFICVGRRTRCENGVLRAENGTLMGTALGLSELVGRLARFTGWDVADAIRAGSVTPRAVLGLADVSDPLIAVGQDADLVLAAVDGQRIDVKLTMVAGKVVYHG